LHAAGVPVHVSFAAQVLPQIPQFFTSVARFAQ
jgi:hypothetical protein